MKKKIAEFFEVSVPETCMVTVREDTKGSPYIPVRKPGYVFRKEILSDFLAWADGTAGKDPIYLTGSTGTGKSTTVEQVAAALQQPLYVVSCHEAMEGPDFMGHYVVQDGNMKWQDGPLVAGLKDPLGAWILLDEVDTLRPGAAMVLNAVIEGRNIIIPETGEMLNPRTHGAKIICAGNTAGLNDETGSYSGTNRQNLAFMARFMIVKMGYPNPTDEQKIVLMAVPNLQADIAKGMIKVANDIREVYENGETEIVFCTRSLIRWGELFCRFLKKGDVEPLSYTLDRAIGYKLKAASRAGLHEMVQRVLNPKPKGAQS